MKILFLCTNSLWDPHFETELELMKEHSQDDVYVLSCPKVLKACTCNVNNLKSLCIDCCSRFKQGIEQLQIPKEQVIDIERAPFKKYHFTSVKELENFTIDGVPHGRGVASNLISEFRDIEFDPEVYQDKINRKINTSLSIYTSMVAFIKRYKPDRCYFFNGRFADSFSAIYACRQYGIEYYTHERGANKDSYTLYKNSGIHESLESIKSAVEAYWNGDKTKGRVWFEQRLRKVEQNWISFTADQKKDLLPCNFDTSKRNIAFFNTSIHEFAVYSDWDEQIYGKEDKAIRAIVQQFPSIHFYLRVHPNLANCNNFQIKALKKIDHFSNLSIIWPEEKIDSYALLQACEKSIVFGSTMGAEACYLGKPSILVGRAYYEGTGCCYIPNTEEELFALIERGLEPKEQIAALKYANWMSERGIAFKHYQADTLFSGRFLGERLKPNLTPLELAQRKFYRRIEVTKKSIQKRLK